MAHHPLGTPTSVTPLFDHSTWRPEWGSERPRYWWYLTFEHEAKLRHVVSTLQDALRHVDAVEPIPLRWLHLTVQDIGFVDELRDDEVSQVAAGAAEHLDGHRPLRFGLGSATTMGSAVVLQAHPAEQLTALRSRLRLATGGVLGASALPGPVEFRPHLSLGYLNRDCDAAEVLDPLRSLQISPVHVDVGGVTLVAVTRGHRSYRWDTRAEIPLEPGLSRSAGRPRRR
jgi:2'-5' RNA ligase